MEYLSLSVSAVSIYAQQLILLQVVQYNNGAQLSKPIFVSSISRFFNYFSSTLNCILICLKSAT